MLCTIYKNAIKFIVPKIQITQSFKICSQKEEIKTQDADLIASKIRYLYTISPEYREKNNDLLNEAQIDIKLSLFSLINIKKKSIKSATLVQSNKMELKTKNLKYSKH